MNILAFETSTEFCSVALLTGGDIRHAEQHAGNQHSELILSMVSDLLLESGISLQQLNGIAFGEGPGSFTGLRIACGVAQGLAFALNIPVVGVSTLKALAAQTESTRVVVALDARMGEIYYAAYEKIADQDWQTVNAPTLCAPRNAPNLIGNDWVGCGSGFDVFSNELSERYLNHIQETRGGLFPRAKEIVQLALPILKCGKGIHPSAAVPSYIRNKVALKENER
ncbi:tRNA threonylcarbamoyladenosine biosynthesis protein TsaB [Nitrosomonas sp. PY1]|uniref:tRNA (adenosine(37)-N6)-threonylcarbamoyltransferase complex dimerization subunit type 1 TsaB n=1 Tax=Nitrosomonas sp. PY1 TaxID=1803906 RepID=UPI001FC7FF71|nr:tRNA (adenosine(37)-N6)-threonylcarbamoyltransferase complex dimerization subunit type 1 TsaB [Nitrosomonas sp. PY1]GKS68388.1 tRNA threonylcarbamoyladenosine biosynthesis protein TsaB [Nitrosomonas sp. PY1]